MFRFSESNLICGCGGTGRRARLRGVWSIPYGFDSHQPHQIRTLYYYKVRIFILQKLRKFIENRNFKNCGFCFKLFKLSLKMLQSGLTCMFYLAKNPFRMLFRRQSPLPATAHAAFAHILNQVIIDKIIIMC